MILKFIRKIAVFMGTFPLVLLLISLLRAALMQNENISAPCNPQDSDYISNSRGLSIRLSQSLKFQTISFGPHDYNRSALLELAQFLTTNFPLIHSSAFISREIVNNYSLLYYVEGKDTALKPYLLAGHLDVVPVEEDMWEVPPFSGEIKDGFIWGRGSIDCKHIVMGSLEALEFLLEKGYQPHRSFYLAFGHDEETNGYDGAQHISKILKSKGVKLEYILDEGTFVLEDMVPGITSPVAFIGITEKGNLHVELSVTSLPGHSAIPPKETSIVILAKALAKLEGNVFPSMLGKGPEEDMFRELALCANFPTKVVLGNLWLFKPIITWKMENTLLGAVLRTSTAVTMVSGGTKINVLPGTATAKVNHRIHPAQTIEETVTFVKQIINDDRVKLTVLSQQPPHPVSSIDSFGYHTVKNTVRMIYNDSCVVPITLMANTDTKWYLDLTKSIYRFSLVRMKPKDTIRFHGHNERIGIENYVQLVNFYLHLMKNSDVPKVDAQHSHSSEL